MNKFINILTIVVLMICFSSCSKTELEGIESQVISTKKSTENPKEIIEEEKVRPNGQLRSEDEDDINEDDTVTDDEDDEDDDEGKSDVDK